MACNSELIQRDLGLPDAEDGQTTMDEITLDGVPTIRLMISDVLMDGSILRKEEWVGSITGKMTNETIKRSSYKKDSFFNQLQVDLI